MARTQLSRPLRTTAGVALSPQAPSADGIAFPFTKSTVLLVYNGQSSNIAVTFQRPGSVDDTALGPKTVTVPANSYAAFSDWDSTLYAQEDGRLYVDFSSVTNVWVMVL